MQREDHLSKFAGALPGIRTFPNIPSVMGRDVFPSRAKSIILKENPPAGGRLATHSGYPWMAEEKKSDPNSTPERSSGFKRGMDQLMEQSANLFSMLRSKTEGTLPQIKEVLYSTSDQVLGKAEETRKSVKFRMAILEIEHHLNRLYPQIGKLTCDLVEKGAKDWQKDKNLKTKIDLAEEYRQRLDELKKDLMEHQQKSPEESE